MGSFVVIVNGKIRVGIPTALLIEQGGAREAYFVPANIKAGGVWFMRDATHQSPDGKYERVTVGHTSDWTADFDITVTEPGQEPYRYEDTFYVEALDRNRAERLALAEAERDIERRFGDVASDIRIIRIGEGGMFR